MTARRAVHHTLDVYDTYLHLVTTVKQFEATCRDLGGEDGSWTPWESAGMVQTYHSGDGTDGFPEHHVVVCIDGRVIDHDTATPGAVIKLIAHEGTHAAALILDHAAQPYDGGSETLAYLAGWLTEWIWNHLQ